MVAILSRPQCVNEHSVWIIHHRAPSLLHFHWGYCIINTGKWTGNKPQQTRRAGTKRINNGMNCISLINQLLQRQNGGYFVDDIFKCIWYECFRILISLKFDPKGSINNMPAQVIVWTNGFGFRIMLRLFIRWNIRSDQGMFFICFRSLYSNSVESIILQCFSHTDHTIVVQCTKLCIIVFKAKKFHPMWITKENR